MILLFVLTLLGHAADPVLHAGEDPRLLLAKSAAATKRPDEELRVLTVGELVRGKPAVLLGGVGRVKSCFGTPTAEVNVREAIERVQRALAYLEYEKAISHVQVGEETIQCLAGPADAQRISRLFFLKGFVSSEDGDTAGARAAFDVALTVDPELGWDEYFPPDAKPLFDEVSAEVAGRQPIAIQINPIPQDGYVWVDGRRVTVTNGEIALTPGRHLVQISGLTMRSYWVEIRPTSAPAAEKSEGPSEPQVEGAAVNVKAAPAAALIVPGALTDSSLAAARDAAQRDALDAVLGVLFDPGAMVYVSIDGLLVAHPVGTQEWTELKIPSGFSSGGPGGRLVAGRSLMWTGAIVTAGGLVTATTSYIQASSAARSASDDEDWRSYDRSKIEYESAQDRMVISRWALLGGVVIAGVGIGLQYDQLPFSKRKEKKTASAALVPLVDHQTAGVGVVIQTW